MVRWVAGRDIKELEMALDEQRAIADGQVQAANALAERLTAKNRYIRELEAALAKLKLELK